MPKLFSIHLLIYFCMGLQVKAQETKDQPIQIRHCSIHVAANMFTATTVLDIEFYNPNSKVLDGEFKFALQAGQVVTGFLLDINGVLREGVIVDKQQGRVAYENTIRRRIDPALLEQTEGSQYRLRIYPMPANGSRKATIVIKELLVAHAGLLAYHLPISFNSEIKALDVTCIVDKTAARPFVAEGLLSGKSFEKQDENHLLSFSKKNLPPNQQLSFQIPIKPDQGICWNDQSNSFALHTTIAANPVTSKDSVNHATVFWDVSSSSKKRLIEKEISMLQAFLHEKNVRDLTIVTFSNRVLQKREFRVNDRKFSPIKNFLANQFFDGGTRLGSLSCSQFSADLFLLFSDGINNLGDEQIHKNGNPIYCINSASVANHQELKKISASTGGMYLDLSTSTIDECIHQLHASPLQLLSVKQGDIDLAINMTLKAPVTTYLTLTGKLQNRNDIVLTFGGFGQQTTEKRIPLQSSFACKESTLDTAFLLQQYGSIQNNELGDAATSAFAKAHHFVGKKTSFIVLDNVDDYIEYGIVPPADLTAQYQQKLYVVEQKAAAQELAVANETINNLKTTATLYNERIRWWSKDEALIKVDNIQLHPSPTLITTTPGSKDEPANAAAAPFENKSGGFNRTSALTEVVVVGYGTRSRREVTGSVTRVSASEISRSGALTIGQALQGRVAGVQVIQSGMPGVSDKIIIRGTRSLTGNNQPLYILDGVRYDASILNRINVNDIESISVIRDASASAIYGSEAANGVIILTSKRGSSHNYVRSNSPVKYDDLEDMDYIEQLQPMEAPEIYQQYLSMKDSFIAETAFYFDVAQLLFEKKDLTSAITVLTNLAEMDNENHQLLRAMAYRLESWKQYDLAIEMYQKVLDIKEEEPQSYRDLALAYERNGQHQFAVEILYKVITKNFYQYENRYRGIKSLLLNEMNAIIYQNNCSIEQTEVNPAIIKPLPVDIRIVIDWNKDETDMDLHIIEPGGEECFYQHKQSHAGGRLSEDFTQGYGPEEYQVKKAQSGKYSVLINYYGDRFQKIQTPSFVKLTIYKNFGKPNQSVRIETFLLNNQNGKIEIADLKY